MAKTPPPPPPKGPPPPPKAAPPKAPPAVPESVFTQEVNAKATATRIRSEASKKLKELSASEFSKMEIISYEKVSDSYKEISKFKVSINPQHYKRSFSIPGTVLDEKKKANKEAIDIKVVEFKETLSFDLFFDCTGAIPDTKEVKEDLDWLAANLVEFDGEMHATRYVKIKWGVLDFFYGQLKSMGVDYLYFDRTGRPLRAKANLSFERIVSTNKKESKSPDLTHVREVQAGDTLPGMCNMIYKDPSYYLKVAEENGLPHFTNLVPGQKIYFPPLK